MAYPQYNPFGVPYTGNPVTEAADLLGAGGLWFPRGGSRAPNPGYRSTDLDYGVSIPEGWVQVGGPVDIPHNQPVSATPVDWVVSAEPRDPYVPVLDVAPTPTPSNVIERESSPINQPRGETKPALKKSKATSVGSGTPWRWILLEGEGTIGYST